MSVSLVLLVLAFNTVNVNGLSGFLRNTGAEPPSTTWQFDESETDSPLRDSNIHMHHEQLNKRSSWHEGSWQEENRQQQQQQQPLQQQQQQQMNGLLSLLNCQPFSHFMEALKEAQRDLASYLSAQEENIGSKGFLKRRRRNQKRRARFWIRRLHEKLRIVFRSCMSPASFRSILEVNMNNLFNSPDPQNEQRASVIFPITRPATADGERIGGLPHAAQPNTDRSFTHNPTRKRTRIQSPWRATSGTRSYRRKVASLSKDLSRMVLRNNEMDIIILLHGLAALYDHEEVELSPQNDKDKGGTVIVKIGSVLREVPAHFLSVTLGPKIILRGQISKIARSQKFLTLARGLSPAILRMGGTMANFVTYSPTSLKNPSVPMNEDKFEDDTKTEQYLNDNSNVNSSSTSTLSSDSPMPDSNVKEVNSSNVSRNTKRILEDGKITFFEPRRQDLAGEESSNSDVYGTFSGNQRHLPENQNVYGTFSGTQRHIPENQNVAPGHIPENQNVDPEKGDLFPFFSDERIVEIDETNPASYETASYMRTVAAETESYNMRLTTDKTTSHMRPTSDEPASHMRPTTEETESHIMRTTTDETASHTITTTDETESHMRPAADEAVVPHMEHNDDCVFDFKWHKHYITEPREDSTYDLLAAMLAAREAMDNDNTGETEKHKDEGEFKENEPLTLMLDQPSDFATSSCDSYTKSDYQNFTMTAEDWSELTSLAESIGMNLLFDLNQFYRTPEEGDWDPSNARMIFSAAAARKDHVLWQLGNEPNAYGHKFNISFSGRRDAQDYAQLHQELTKHFEKPSIIGPDVTRPKNPDVEDDDGWEGEQDLTKKSMEFLEEFLTNLDVDLTALSWHQYYVDGRTATVHDFTSFEVLDQLAWQIPQVVRLRDQLAPNTPIWMTETSSAYGGGAPGLSNSYAGGFLWLDKLGVAAIGGVDVVARQTLYVGCYALVDKDFNPYPDYWLSLLFKKLVGEKVLNLETEVSTMPTSEEVPPPVTRLYAHCQKRSSKFYVPGNVVIYGMNLGNTSATIELQGLENSNYVIHQYLLQPGHNELKSSQVKLNGEELRVTSSEELPELVPSRLAKPEFDIPPLTFGFWVINNANLIDCL